MWLNSTTRMPERGRPADFRSFPRTRESSPLAEELDPRLACPRAGGGGDERVDEVFFLLVAVFFFAVFFAMQIALSASGFGV
jgi:hypothetical protein